MLFVLKIGVICSDWWVLCRFATVLLFALRLIANYVCLQIAMGSRKFAMVFIKKMYLLR